MASTVEKRKYLELADYLRESIRSGNLKVGERLPSYAELYQKHGASTATVQRACDLLHQERLIDRRHGSGIYVAAPSQNTSGTIGLIGTESFRRASDPYYMSLMNAIHQALDAEQRHMLYLGTQDAWDTTATDKVDGVLLCGVDQDSPIFKNLPPHLPRVSLLTTVDDITSVGVDDYRGAQIAVRHLLAMGHKRIGYLMEKHAWQARRRIAGYKDALEEVGIEPEAGWQRLAGPVARNTNSQSYIEWAHHYMQYWLDNGWEESSCTAILAQNDVAAIGVIQVLQKAGFKLPEQVSVMGFDGTNVRDYITPRLTTMAMPLTQIGTRAVEILTRQIKGETEGTETILLPLSLLPGDSVADLR